VPNSRKRKIEESVDQLLKDSGVSKAPVPIDRIARQLNITVKFSPTREDVSGALVVKGGAAFIAVNGAHHENRQRFTIAHEIGHYYLHDTGERTHFDEDFRVYGRNKNSSQANDPQEIEANQFAAELLMPQKFLLVDFSGNRGERVEIVAKLARKYKVSPQAMEYRLANLGLLVPNFDPQDD
jgi:Zn-dependent peptidase ImmA (M78 family)